jgi:hypothetical protein
MPDREAPDRLSDDDLDALLREASHRVSVPADLVPRIRRRLDGRRRMGVGLATLATAAALLIGATLWVLWRSGGVSTAPDGPFVARPAPEPAVPSENPQGDVIVMPGPGLLARHVETSDPRVSIVLLYREVTPPDAPELEEPDPERNET